MVSKKRKQIRQSILSSANKDFKGMDLLFVLDEDPVIAARSLILKHIKSYTSKIEESLLFQYMFVNELMPETSIKRRLCINPIPIIFKNEYNIYFFSTMYEELIKIQKAIYGYNISYTDKFDADEMLFNYKLAINKGTNKKVLIPNYLPNIKSKSRKFREYKKYDVIGIDNPSNSLIDLHRLMYIIDGYSLDQFPCGAPAWYSPLRREIYRKYDKLSKKTFVIEVDETGRYRYFFTHISNKLREITDIKDMRELIDSFLFNS